MSKIGTKKVYWPDIKEKIKETNIEFYTLVDQLNPGQDFPLYLLTFPYGELIGDETSQFLPIEKVVYLSFCKFSWVL